MKQENHILNQFPKASFWDVDPAELDLKSDWDFIIPRALFLTTAATFKADISSLENIYSSQQILEALQSTRERVSNSVCLMVADRYHVAPFLRFRI